MSLYRRGEFTDPTGSYPHLAGKKAILLKYDGDHTRIHAQFENFGLKESVGWWTFPSDSFIMDDELQDL